MIKNLLLKIQLPALITLGAFTMIHQPETQAKEISFEIEEPSEEINTTENPTTTTIQKENFDSQTIKLMEKGYINYEIKTIYNKLTKEQINYLLTKNYINITEYLKYQYFKFSNIDRYIKHQDKNNLKVEDTIIRVNIGLDNPFYTNTEIIQNPDSLLVLVNKYNQLPADYIPENLIALKCNPKYQLREEAAIAFNELIEAAKQNNVNVYPYSAYRSYEYQNKIYNRYVNKDGEELADTYSARPGHSEHQTGLSVDIKSVGYNEITDSDYEWMKENAHLYGYIIRYPENSTEITGYQEEPWHLRYVGIEIATEIKDLDITFDEYYQIKLLENKSIKNTNNQSIQYQSTETIKNSSSKTKVLN